MATNSIDGYLRWITPTPGDPTYSLLKAHLLFEELLRAYLARVLPHSGALEGSRLTFVQLLAVARASSVHVPPDHWSWQAISELNRLRNMLSHEARPKDMAAKVDQYIKLVVNGTGRPLPEPVAAARAPSSAAETTHLFGAVDMVTLGLYYHVGGLLGFSVDAIAQREESRIRDLQASLTPIGNGNAA